MFFFSSVSPPQAQGDRDGVVRPGARPEGGLRAAGGASAGDELAQALLGPGVQPAQHGEDTPWHSNNRGDIEQV